MWRGAAGETTGYDDCAASLVCSEGLCTDICQPFAPAGSLGACESGSCTGDPLIRSTASVADKRQ